MNKAVLILGILFSTHYPLQAQTRTPSEQWIIDQQQDLFPVPITRQSEVKPGTLIELLNTGETSYVTPDQVIPPGDQPFTVGGSESIKALKVGLLAKFLGIGLSAKLQSTQTVSIDQTEFHGVGYSDKDRERVILQPSTAVVKEYEYVQDQYDKKNRSIPIYLVQSVYSTANLNVEGARNLVLEGSVNSDQPDSCTAVTVPKDPQVKEGTDVQPPKDPIAAADPTKKANDQQGSAGPGGTGGATGKAGVPGVKAAGVAAGKQVADAAVKEAADVVAKKVTDGAAGAGGGMQLCKGSGGRDVLKATTPIPVMMKVCWVFYAPKDHSWNCGKAHRDLTFK